MGKRKSKGPARGIRTSTPDAARRVPCPYCHHPVPEDRLRAHLRKPPCSIAAEAAAREALGVPDVDEEPGRPLLVLVSQRGRLVMEGGTCAECRRKAKRLWRYAETSVGVASVCSRCKPQVFDRSFGPVDAWAAVVDRKKAPPR